MINARKVLIYHQDIEKLREISALMESNMNQLLFIAKIILKFFYHMLVSYVRNSRKILLLLFVFFLLFFFINGIAQN